MIIVTGSLGLIGYSACDFFSKKNHKVIGIDNDMRSYFFGKNSSNKWKKKIINNKCRNHNKLMEIKHGATGFMLIERCVFEKVIDLAPEFKYSSHTMNDFFPCKVVNGEYLTEDYAFCQMWREKGGKIWADLSICLNHEGWHSYQGNPFKTFELISNSK